MSVTRRSERARNLRARAAELPWPRCATSFYRPVLFCRSACGPPADVLVTLSVIERARWHDRPDHRRALAHRLGWRCVDDSTDLNGAVVSSLSTLDAEPAASDVTWRDGAVVLFTDGTDQHVFSIGLGGEVDEPALRQPGKDGYWPVAKADQLDGPSWRSRGGLRAWRIASTRSSIAAPGAAHAHAQGGGEPRLGQRCVGGLAASCSHGGLSPMRVCRSGPG